MESEPFALIDLFLAQAVGLSPAQKSYTCDKETCPEIKSYGETTQGCWREKEGVLNLARALTLGVQLTANGNSVVSTSFSEQLS